MVAMNAWPHWVSIRLVQTTCNCTDDTWNAWANTAAATTTTTGYTGNQVHVWTEWAAGTETTGAAISYTYEPTWANWAETVIETAEEKQRRIEDTERRRLEYAEQARKAQEEREAAQKKAKELLEMVLNQKQKVSLQNKGYFDVTSSRGLTYRIRQGSHGNVKRLLADGREGASLCAAPPGVPQEDAMLAQKLMLEQHEEDYLRVANVTRLLDEAEDIIREAQAIKNGELITA